MCVKEENCAGGAWKEAVAAAAAAAKQAAALSPELRESAGRVLLLAKGASDLAPGTRPGG